MHLLCTTALRCRDPRPEFCGQDIHESRAAIVPMSREATRRAGLTQNFQLRSARGARNISYRTALLLSTEVPFFLQVLILPNIGLPTH